jgi:hypothetical protein
MAKGRPKSKFKHKIYENKKQEQSMKKIKFYFDNIWKHEHEKKVNKAAMQNYILN